MRRFAAALLVALFAVPLPQSAHAAPCPMVTDPVGDANGFVDGANFPVSDPAMDIERADMVTTATSLKVSVILNQYALADSYAPDGRLVEFTLTGKGITKTIDIVIDPTGNVTSTPSGGPKMDQTSRAVWVAVPLTSLGYQGLRASTRKKAGDKFTSLRVAVYRYANGGKLPSPAVAADTAASAANWSYVHRAKSCIS